MADDIITFQGGKYRVQQTPGQTVLTAVNDEGEPTGEELRLSPAVFAEKQAAAEKAGREKFDDRPGATVQPPPAPVVPPPGQRPAVAPKDLEFGAGLDLERPPAIPDRGADDPGDRAHAVQDPHVKGWHDPDGFPPPNLGDNEPVDIREGSHGTGTRNKA